MNRAKHIFTGTAGVYYVMYKLAAEGIHASCTHGNAPNVDILVSSANGSHHVAIEVKTTEDALRWRGPRGGAKQPHHVEFPLGHRAAKLNHANLILAFVDLRASSKERTPDVYLYPSKVVADSCREWVDKVPMVRFHVPVKLAEPYKNNWSVVRDALGLTSRFVDNGTEFITIVPPSEEGKVTTNGL